jgi:hypothetical protein
LVWHKKFGPAQNIFGPVKGQGISLLKQENIAKIRLRFASFGQNSISSSFKLLSTINYKAASNQA